MIPSALARKLVVRPGNSVLVVNAPAGYLEGLVPLPEGATATDRVGGRFDVVQLFASSRQELEEHLGDAIRAVQPGGILWVSYPKLASKGAGDLSRDRIRELVDESTDWTTVSQVAVDDTWSALRLRPAEDVKSSRR